MQTQFKENCPRELSRAAVYFHMPIHMFSMEETYASCPPKHASSDLAPTKIKGKASINPNRQKHLSGQVPATFGLKLF